MVCTHVYIASNSNSLMVSQLREKRPTLEGMHWCPWLLRAHHLECSVEGTEILNTNIVTTSKRSKSVICCNCYFTQLVLTIREHAYIAKKL